MRNLLILFVFIFFLSCAKDNDPKDDLQDDGIITGQLSYRN